MAPDPQPTATGQAPALDQTNQNAVLTVDAVKTIITEAQAGGADPVTVGMQIFSNLGNNATASGDILRQALTDSGIALAGPLAALVAAAETITKLGSEITVTSAKDTTTDLSGTPIRFKSLVSLTIGTTAGLPDLTNIQGLSAHKLFWLSITQIQLQEVQGRRVLHVVTSAGAKDFPLP